MTVVRVFAAIWIALAIASSASASDAEFSLSELRARADQIRAQIVADPSQGLRAADNLKDQAGGLKDSALRSQANATADWLRAEAFTRTNRASDAIRITDSAIAHIGKSSGNARILGDLLLTRGGAAEALGRPQQALSDYQRGYTAYTDANHVRGQAVALQKLGSIYREAGDYRGALRYEGQAIDVYPSDPLLLLTAYNTRGNALVDAGRYASAAVEYRKAFIAAGKLGSPLLQVRVLQNLARAYAQTGDLDQAEATLRRAYGIARHPDAASWTPALDGVAALIALKRDRLAQADSLIERSFSLSEAAKAAMSVRDLHETAYRIYAKLGDAPKALYHLEQFKKLDDEKRAITASAAAALMSARFDFANQDAKIARLGAEQERTRARFRSTVLYGLLAAVSVVTALLLIGFISLRRSRNQVRAANAELSTTNVALERALAAKSEFLATTSHEIRTPLNGILGMTQVILTDRSLDAPLRNRIELVHGAGETMKALVDDILDMAKMETGELVIHPAEMDLVRLLGDAAQIWAGRAETKQLALHVDVADAPTRIIADEVRLRQIVFNLMANAIKFTDRGHVRLSAAVDPDPDGAGERLLVRVEDTGIGIAPDKLEAIFAAFQQIDGGVTRRHGGTGLGLAICRSLARAMGGDVHVASSAGVGSTFTLMLPLARAAPVIVPATRIVTGLAQADLLLVEGNPLSQGIMRAILGAAVGGLHIVGTIETAEEALRAGGLDHVLADGATLGLDAGAVLRLAAAAAAQGARFTLLWPAAQTIDDALAASDIVHVVSKPIAAPDLLAALKTLYQADDGQDIAA